MILKFCMQLQWTKHYKVYINDDPGLTVTYFTARLNRVTYTIERGGKLFQDHFFEKTCSKWLIWLNKYAYEKVWPKGVVPALWLYTSVWTPFSKIFISETPWPIKSKFYVLGKDERKYMYNINGSGHMTKMATTPIYTNSKL